MNQMNMLSVCGGATSAMQHIVQSMCSGGGSEVRCGIPMPAPLLATSSKILLDCDGLYDRIRNDNDDFISLDEFHFKVDELVETGFIEARMHEDSTLYSARPGLKWSEFVHIDDRYKKEILLLLIENPTTFFILVNTQQGKMRIASLEIKQWSNDTTYKVVAFMIVDNDTTLADQSVDGLKGTFGEKPVRIFKLSTSSKNTFDEIKTYIDAYAGDQYNEYPMPLIALLSNPKQCEKMLKLQHHINKRIERSGSNLRYGQIWDEADKTYVALRDKTFNIEGVQMSCRDFILDNNTGLYRLGFVSATDGDLLDEDYPECANAYLYPVDISPEDKMHYRALHHAEAIVECVPFTSKHTNNSYATQILEEKAAYFTTPVELPNGQLYYRKIIINSNAKTEDMKQFARWCNSQSMHAIVFNSSGGASVKVYQLGKSVVTYKTKGKKLNELLFYVYKKLELNDKPIVIIGRRKVDRGLGFHYCPRSNDEITIDGELGKLVTSNRESLIWTDEILGRIDNKNIAVQKAGRLAGIIGNSPQYCGHITFWTDAYTENLIRRHNTIVEKTNTMSGCSVLQAVCHAEDTTPRVPIQVSPPDIRLTVPTIMQLTKAEIDVIVKASSAVKHANILNRLKAIYPDIETYKCVQVTAPKVDNSYTKHITALVDAAAENKGYKIDIKPADNYTNCYMCFIDLKENRLCYIVWNGGLLKDPALEKAEKEAAAAAMALAASEAVAEVAAEELVVAI